MNHNRRLKRLSYGSLLFGVLLKIIAFLAFILYFYDKQSHHLEDLSKQTAIENKLSASEHFNEVVYLSSLLYVASGEEKWKLRFKRYKHKLIQENEALLQEFKQQDYLYVQGKGALVALKHTLTEYDKIIHLAQKGEKTQASKLLHSAEYFQSMSTYLSWIQGINERKSQGLDLIALRGEILAYDEVLTNSARMAAFTGDLSWEAHYRSYETKLDSALSKASYVLEQAYKDKDKDKDKDKASVSETDQANQALISMENEAFSLVKNNNLNKAKAILFSAEYQKQKRIYAHGMEELLNQIQSIAKDKQDKIASQFDLMLSIMIIGLIVLILIWFVIFWVLQRYAKSEKHTQNELRKLNETLDIRVKARTLELEKAQEKLLSSQQFLEAIFSRVNSFLFVLDKELNITMINQTALNKLNFSEKELVGENIFSLLDAGTQKDKIQEVLLSTEDHTIETELISKDKKPISVLFTCTTLNKSTLSPAIICAAQDISELKETKEQLMQAQKLESIGKLAGGVAHDFNNLLMGIMGHTDLLLLKLKDEKLLKHVQAILSSSQKASGLTKQLLGFARKGKYERSILNANMMIEETLLILKSVLNKNIRIDCKLQEDLWPIEGDSGQISQVLMNIAVNAKDAMPEGGRLQFATSNIYADESFCQVNTMLSIGAYIDISISDSGIGMSKEMIQKMFEPFYTTKEVGKGTGLGLSMVYGIIKNHQGEIRVYSEPGVGTLFHIYLPAKVEIADENISDKVDLTPFAKLKTVLIGDDEKLLLDLSTDILNQAVPDINILHAKTGKALMEAFELHKNDIDLVITDFMMPELSGFEVIEKIHQSKENLPVLLLSGYDKTDDIEVLLKDRQIAFLQKPYQKKAFLQVIWHLLEGGRGGGNA